MSHLMLSRHGIWYYRRVYSISRRRREILTINRCVNAYLAATKEPFSKRSAAAFVDGLEGSASTRNHYIKKNSAFFKWLATRTDEEIRNPFEGWALRKQQHRWIADQPISSMI